MGYHDVLFPEDLTYASAGAPGLSVSAIETDSGHVERVARWTSPHYGYDAAYNLKTRDQAIALQAFYIAREGPANTFRYKDFLDFASTANGRTDPTATASTDQFLGTGDGSRVDFQLRKGYTSGAQTKYRNITKPVVGTVSVSLNDVTQGSGWSVNPQTGVVTFTSAPAIGVTVKAGFQFHVPVYFDPAIDREGLRAAIEAFDTVEFPSIPLLEDFDGRMVDDDYPYGGSQYLSFDANITLTQSGGRVKVLAPTTGGLTATLPDKASMPEGEGLMLLVNNSANTVAIKDGATTVFTLAASPAVAEVLLGRDSSNALKYYGVSS